jgi:dipeptidyl aminopeptidase/acylaminoacyl peptidase
MIERKYMNQPYGTWKSPITANLIAGKTVSLNPLKIENNSFYWLESRPSESGRLVVMRQLEGKTDIITPVGFNVRSRVHEYGGGAVLITNGVIYFIDYDSQQIFCQKSDKAPYSITKSINSRFADMQFDSIRNRIICVQEDHSKDGEPLNKLIAVNLQSGFIDILDDEHDFVSSPRIDNNCDNLAWLTWDHPNMPWDGSTLWTSEFSDKGFLKNKKIVAGGLEESIFQPEWFGTKKLIYISDRSNWWNLYMYADQKTFPIYLDDAEYGLPQWAFGMSTYGITEDNHIIATRNQGGLCQLGIIRNSNFEVLDLPYTEFTNICVDKNKVMFVGSSSTKISQLVCLDMKSKDHEVLRVSSTVNIDPGYISEAVKLEFSNSEESVSYGFYYRPKNLKYVASNNELPPLIVRGHGGPTGFSSDSLNLSIQFWTSRGFAVLDVNYRGSSGFGRKYRKALDEKWGVSDVDDMVNGALYLVEKNKVDKKRLIIRGGSAGGYTTLAALTFRSLFSAGASHYGIGDLISLSRDTHKFESCYLDTIIGKLPENKNRYLERSPINYADQLKCPVIFLQGVEDKVVPPNQAETMVNALKLNGVPVSYLSFEGEGHGFRKDTNIEKALIAELSFYGRIFNFEPDHILADLKIHNY